MFRQLRPNLKEHSWEIVTLDRIFYPVRDNRNEPKVCTLHLHGVPSRLEVVAVVVALESVFLRWVFKFLRYLTLSTIPTSPRHLLNHSHSSISWSISRGRYTFIFRHTMSYGIGNIISWAIFPEELKSIKIRNWNWPILKIIFFEIFSLSQKRCFTFWRTQFCIEEKIYDPDFYVLNLWWIFLGKKLYLESPISEYTKLFFGN